MKHLITLLTLTVFLFGGLQLEAAPQKRSKKTYKISRYLKLTPSQKRKLKKITRKNKSKVFALKKRGVYKKRLLKKAMASNASEQKIRRINGEINTLQQQIKKIKFKKTLSIRKVLSKEQRKKFFSLKKSKTL